MSGPGSVGPSSDGGPGAAAGRVVEFDETVGLGTVEAADGRRYAFHCTQIAGGSRRIDVGTAVAFQVRPARLGTWEAAGVTPVASP